VGSALRLIHLAFGLHLLVARDLAGSVHDGTLDLVGGTFDVFAIHNLGSSRVASWPNVGDRSSFPRASVGDGGLRLEGGPANNHVASPQLWLQNGE
jgi:hypothetical protein